MTASYTQFTPSTTTAFQFQPTLAGTQYNATVTWNLFGQRYYLNLYDLSGNLIIATAIVGTGPQLAATLTWIDTGVSGVATATCAVNHNVPLGALANMFVAGTGTAYDGAWQVLSTSATTLTYALTNPNETQPLAGTIGFQTNLVAPAGIAGFLCYLYSTQQFAYA